MMDIGLNSGGDTVVIDEGHQDPTLILIKTHQLKENNILNMDNLDIATKLNRLGIPDSWIQAIHSAKITGKQLIGMYPDWDFFNKMGFYDHRELLKITKWVREELKNNKKKFGKKDNNNLDEINNENDKKVEILDKESMEVETLDKENNNKDENLVEFKPVATRPYEPPEWKTVNWDVKPVKVFKNFKTMIEIIIVIIVMIQIIEIIIVIIEIIIVIIEIIEIIIVIIIIIEIMEIIIVIIEMIEIIFIFL